MDAASDEELLALARLARHLGMDVLVECHDAGQLDRAVCLPTTLLGINNRDLRTLETRLETTLELLQRVPPDRLVVAESGIAEPADVARLAAFGVSAYLVGTAFMSSPDPGARLAELFFGG
jgi:indole-3-glycerol phosphate synthase